MTRLLERLDAEIARAEGVYERECLKARRAAVLARHGQFAEARFALQGLRSQSQRLKRPALGAWIALIEGLIEHFGALAPSARAKFQRAYELASGAGEPGLLAECAAWLSNSDLNANDPEATCAHAGEALRVAPADGHAALARATLVVANSWRVAGDDARAQPWYKRARHHAASEGDVSLVSVMLHNLAAFQVGRIGLEDAFGRGDTTDAQRVLLEAESTGNYDEGVGNDKLLAEMPLLRAQLLTVLGRHEEAIALVDAQLPRARHEGQAAREARLLADALYGEARLGRLDEAARRWRQVVAALPLITEADDIAATHARLAATAEILRRADDAATHRALAQEALVRHAADLARWTAALEGAGLVLETAPTRGEPA
jgi:tetratricopeptide (TPR) repeat protein